MLDRQWISIRRDGWHTARRAAIVACLALAAALLALSYARTLAAQDASITTWVVPATDIYLDGNQDPWFVDNTGTSVNRLEPAATGTVTTWPLLEGSLALAGTIAVDDASQQLKFAEGINRPGLRSLAVASLDLANHSYTEWPLGAPDWDSPYGANIVTLKRDGSGNIWFGGRNRFQAAIGRLEPGDGTFTQWQLPAGTLVLDILLAPGGDIDFTTSNPGQVGRLDPTTGNATLWPLDFLPTSAVGAPDLHMDAGGKLWLHGADRIVKLDPNTDELTTWDLNGAATAVVMAMDSQERPVFGGWLSVAAPAYGTARLDPSTNVITKWNYTNTSSLRGVVLDSSGNIWVSMNTYIDQFVP